MSQEVSEAEYQYYRTERLAIADLERGGIVMFYAKLQAGDPTIIDSAESSRCERDNFAFARTRCRINKIITSTVLPTQIDLGFDSKNIMEREVRLAATEDNVYTVRTSVSLRAIHRAFFNVITDHNLAQIDFALPDIQIGKGFYVPDGFLVDTELHGSETLQSMMVRGTEDGDGSAGAMVPARPKYPSPMEAAEIENPRAISPLQ